MIKKRADFNFVVLFGIIVGAMILVLAIYGATKIGNTKRHQTDTEIAKQILILTDPLQAGFAEGKYGKIEFKQETRINNDCFQEGFGKNRISVSTESNVGEKWQKSGEEVPVYNKYIFSNSKEQGKNYYVFSKPFYFPYKITDLVFVKSDANKYCFISPPDEIESELVGLNMPNIKVSNSSGDDCSSNSIKVCFGVLSGSDCDIGVYGTCMTNCETAYDEGYVEKNSIRMKYVGSLMYAAIFSEKEIYDCNVKRLLYRVSTISEVFADKIELMNARDCGSAIKTDLLLLGGLAINSTSENLISLNQIAKDVGRKESMEQCGVW